MYTARRSAVWLRSLGCATARLWGRGSVLSFVGRSVLFHLFSRGRHCYVAWLHSAFLVVIVSVVVI